MKISLDSETKNIIKGIVEGSSLECYIFSYTNGGLKLSWRDKIDKFYFDTQTSRYVVSFENNSKLKVSLRELLYYLNNDVYKTKNATLRRLAKAYKEYSKLNDSEGFKNYINKTSSESIFKIEEVEITNDEIEWLNKHVTRITAKLPQKAIRVFERNFPGQPYELSKTAWTYGFAMFFDTVDNIPDTLLNVKNQNNNSIDLENKVMNNTSYIWNLIKSYPDMFEFGKRN